MKKGAIFVGLFLLSFILIGNFAVSAQEENILISQNIGNFEFTESYFDDDCGLLFVGDSTWDGINCNLYGTKYLHSIYQVTNNVNIEKYLVSFSNGEFIRGITSFADSGGFEPEEREIDGNSYFYLNMESSEDYAFFLWYSGDKLIGISSNFDAAPLDEDEVIEFIETYFDKYPSDLKFQQVGQTEDNEEIPDLDMENNEKDEVIPNEEVPANVQLCPFGCKSENTCLPIGYRTDDEYCGLNRELVPQLEEATQCNNGFECGSNLCIDNQCIEAGLFTKIINWFKNLFG